jgi:hypothetical protein
MKHHATQELFSYWDRCRGARLVPERDDIDPGDIRHALSDTFLLDGTAFAERNVRLAGTRMCALFCRELKGERFLDLWHDADRQTVETLLNQLLEEPSGLVASVVGEAENGFAVILELILLPLATRAVPAHLIGALSLREIPFWLGISPVRSLTLGSYRYIGMPGISSAPRFSAPPRRPFVVIQGDHSSDGA